MKTKRHHFAPGAIDGPFGKPSAITYLITLLTALVSAIFQIAKK